MSEHIVTEQNAGVLRVEMRRPEKKNALTAAMYAAMADALERAEGDPAVRAVLIHGQPDVFTAGNDLQDFLNVPPSDEGAPVFRFLKAISTARKPVVAAVNGVVVGIGTTMLLHCDLIYAGESTRFQLPFATLGLCPEAASSYLLPRLAGYPRAAELLLLGEVFDARAAREIGLVNRVCADAEVLALARERASKLTQLPATSLRLTKQLMKQQEAERIAQAMAEEARHFRQCLASPEAKEAFSAFLEKREPDFSRFG